MLPSRMNNCSFKFNRQSYASPNAGLLGISSDFIRSALRDYEPGLRMIGAAIEPPSNKLAYRSEKIRMPSAPAPQ